MNGLTDLPLGRSASRCVGAADKRTAGKIDVETRILALKGERSPEASSLKTPERIFFTDAARTDRRIGQMEIRTAGIGSVLEEWLIVAGLAEFYSYRRYAEPGGRR